MLKTPFEEKVEKILCCLGKDNEEADVNVTTTVLCYQNEAGEKFTRRETLIFQGVNLIETIIDWLDSSGNTLTDPPVVTGLCENQPEECNPLENIGLVTDISNFK